MKKEHKIELVKELVKELSNVEGIIVANYKGLTFSQMDIIRRTFKESGNGCKVIKNTLLKKALNAISIDYINDMLVHPTVCIIVNKDYANAAKLAKKYANDTLTGKFFEIKGGYFDGMALDKAAVVKLADLPSREELLSRALGSMNAPITNFVSLISNIPRGLLNVLNALKEKKEEK